jgi:hypothetical protein
MPGEGGATSILYQERSFPLPLSRPGSTEEASATALPFPRMTSTNEVGDAP